LAAVSEYLERPIGRETIRWSYAGVRPLYDDRALGAHEVTRDYVLGVEAPPGQPPLLSVFGGKLTTYRRLAEHALEQLASTFPYMRPPWTRTARLPGGDIPVNSFDEWTLGVALRYPSLDPALLHRLCRAFGSRVDTLLAGVTKPADMGRDFGAGLTERELNYLIAYEWAETADDVLWRRSKLGLRMRPEQRVAVERYLEDSHSKSPAASIERQSR